MTNSSTAGSPARLDSPPRKVIVATTKHDFSGDANSRLQQAKSLLVLAIGETERRFSGRRLDLIVFPEYAFSRESGQAVHERAVGLKDPLWSSLGVMARSHRVWMVAPTILSEADGRFSNAAVLINRDGAVAGVYRKFHPTADAMGVLEGGIAPGTDFPVFNCDFGKLGILICWDMAYESAWATLAGAGAELVVLPSASPQTLRPSAAALRHRFYVVNSTPRDNATVLNPIGLTVAQTTESPILVHELDLSFAILHWSAKLDNGKIFEREFGDGAGYDYSVREDTGVFWSNDPQRSIGSMMRDLGLREMEAEVRTSLEARENVLRDTP